MSILAFLKKSKLPSFEDDFIQDQTERAMDKASKVYGAKVTSDPRKDAELRSGQEAQKEWDKNTDPADPASGVMWINR